MKTIYVAFFVSLISTGCGRGTEDLGLIGFCDGYPDWESSAYNLPFPTGDSYKILQGNCRPVTHNRLQQFAYDFEMPVGSGVVAARDGKVELVGGGGGDLACAGEHIVIDHGDGTYARYLHLSKIDVKKGETVRQGEAIGEVGDTGCVGGIPHLHFDVTSHPIAVKTLPVSFANTKANPRGLLHQKTYEAF